MKQLMFLVLSVVLLLLGCGISPEFSHNVEGKVKPWTNENFPDLSVEEGEFSFETAIIKDAGTLKLYLICRYLPEKGTVSFRKIQIEKL